jgi:aryl-alcohol dehydrogenase-like predicted oxidoreductase
VKRKLGSSNLEVSPIGMGCWAIGGPWTIYGKQAGWGDVDDHESIRAIHHALDMGINIFDTAPNYGCGHSERIVGRALHDRRDQVIIATKFGYLVDEETKRVAFYEYDRNSDTVVDHVRQDCETSLHRLDTDYIDLYQFHINAYPPAKAAAIRDVLEQLVEEGKIRYYGWSTDNVEGARTFAKGDACITIQHRLNVVMDAPDMLALCDEHGLASINRGPLARGALTGKFTADATFSQTDLRDRDLFRTEWLVPTLDKLEHIREELTSGGRTLAQGALAWIWARNQRTIPIPGMRTVAQVEENAATMHYGPLSTEQMSRIDELLGRT